MTEIEDRLNTYVGNLTNSINQIKSGKENVKIPSLDIDGVGHFLYIALKNFYHALLQLEYKIKIL